MQVNTLVGCADLACADVDHDRYLMPDVELRPDRISIVLISEGAPADPADGYYAAGDSLFARTTVQSFQEAGASVSSVGDILDLGVYLTPAVKCGKIGYRVTGSTIKACSLLLERELALFPAAKAYLLMGDVAIRAVNQISIRAGHGRAVPAGPTYKIRGGEYFLNGIRLYPSYLQAGPSSFIEKGKHRVISADIRSALRYVGAPVSDRALLPEM